VTVGQGVNDDNSGAGNNDILITAGNYVFNGDTITMSAGSGDNKVRIRGSSTTATFNQFVVYAPTGSGGQFRIEPSDGSTVTFSAGIQSGHINSYAIDVGSEQLQLGWYGNGTINLTGGNSYAGQLRSSQTTNMTGTATMNASYLRIDNGDFTLNGASTRLSLEESGRGNGIIVGGQNNSANLHVIDGQVQSNGGIVVMNISADNNTDRTATLLVDGGRVTAGNLTDNSNKGGRTGIVLINGDAGSALNAPTQKAVFQLNGGVVSTVAINFGATVDSVDNTAQLSTGGSPVGQSATMTVTGGELYIGQYGIVKNDSLLSTSITLSGGTVGAINSNWSSSMDMTLGTTNGNITFKAANEAGSTGYDIALSGVLSGSGGFNKTGDGKLTLTGVNTFTGDVHVIAGSLQLGNSSGSGSFLGDTTNLYLVTGTSLVLSFTGTETIGSLYLDGVAQAAGLYDSTSLAAFISGSGALNVTTSAIPEPSTYAFVAGLTMLGGALWRRKHRASLPC